MATRFNHTYCPECGVGVTIDMWEESFHCECGFEDHWAVDFEEIAYGQAMARAGR